MKDLFLQPCSDCDGKTSYQTISQEFEREGLRIKISGIKAIVCETCGEIYFAPGGSEKLAQVANSMFDLAKVEHQHKGPIYSQVG